MSRWVQACRRRASPRQLHESSSGQTLLVADILQTPYQAASALRTSLSLSVGCRLQRARRPSPSRSTSSLDLFGTWFRSFRQETVPAVTVDGARPDGEPASPARRFRRRSSVRHTTSITQVRLAFPYCFSILARKSLRSFEKNNVSPPTPTWPGPSIRHDQGDHNLNAIGSLSRLSPNSSSPSAGDWIVKYSCSSDA